ncbi:MAG: hypothetical protein MI923_08540 [Phycisphaerales bacterium]|nr:hypothetical protein [Phycisphaerales bacterium]
MSETTDELRRINWSECCGFLRIFRSFRVAIRLATLLPAFLGVFLTYFAGHGLDLIWSSSSQAAVILGQHELDYFMHAGPNAAAVTEKWIADSESEDVKRVGVFVLLEHHAKVTVNRMTASVTHVSPGNLVRDVGFGFLGIVWLLSMHTWYAVFFFLLFILIWGFFGGLVSRVAVLDVSRDEKISPSEAAAYVTPRFWNFAAAPVVPLLFIFFVALCLWILGIIGAIPAVGELIVGVLFFLALLGGFVVACVLIGGLGSAPLISPAIAADDVDAIDALTATYNYVFYHPWKTVFYTLTATCYGAVCLAFVKLFVTIMLWSVGLFMGSSMNWGDAYAVSNGEDVKAESKLDAMWQAPGFFDGRPFSGTFDRDELRFPSSWGQRLIQLWINLLWGGVAAFVVSFFYTASSVNYLLLRHVHDRTDMDEVYFEAAADQGSAQAVENQPAKNES